MNNAQANPIFATTHWSVVLAAGEVDSRESATALEQLCRTYWYPVYAYARRRGLTEHDAQDAVQGMFARILELNSLRQVSADKGRFRSFLLAALNHYLADVLDRARAQKRGGGVQPLRSTPRPPRNVIGSSRRTSDRPTGCSKGAGP